MESSDTYFDLSDPQMTWEKFIPGFKKLLDRLGQLESAVNELSAKNRDLEKQLQSLPTTSPPVSVATPLSSSDLETRVHMLESKNEYVMDKLEKLSAVIPTTSVMSTATQPVTPPHSESATPTRAETPATKWTDVVLAEIDRVSAGASEEMDVQDKIAGLVLKEPGTMGREENSKLPRTIHDLDIVSGEMQKEAMLVDEIVHKVREIVEAKRGESEERVEKMSSSSIHDLDICPDEIKKESILVDEIVRKVRGSVEAELGIHGGYYDWFQWTRGDEYEDGVSYRVKLCIGPNHEAVDIEVFRYTNGEPKFCGFY